MKYFLIMISLLFSFQTFAAEDGPESGQQQQEQNQPEGLGETATGCEDIASQRTEGGESEAEAPQESGGATGAER